MSLDPRLSPAIISPLAPITTATTPGLGTLQPYNASAGALAPVLPALSGVRDGSDVIIEKDSADTSTNAVTATCAGSDTFAAGSTAIPLTVGGERLELQAATINSVRVWKVIRRYVPAIDSFTFGYGGPLAAVTGNGRLYLDSNYVLYRVRIGVGTSPVGASVKVDVKVNGTSIYTVDANRPTVNSGGHTDLGDAANITTFAPGDYLTVDIMTVGTTTAGSDLTLVVQLRRMG